jgi:TolC family type I secretion outer membrane protein
MRGMFRGLIIVPAFMALAAGPAVAAEVFRLSDALALAYSTNPELEAQRAKVRAADDAVAEARGNWRPSINASGSYGGERVDLLNGRAHQFHTPGTGRAVISQPVITGGQEYAQIQRAIALVRAARADLLNAEQQILLAAATAYLDTVRDTEGVRLHREDVDILDRQRIATKTQLDMGDATRTDLQQVEVRIAAAQADLAQAQAQLAQSRDSFERIIGRPPETLEKSPPLPPLPATLEQMLAIALRLNPRIQSAQANDKAAQYGIDNAVGALLPHASIVAEYDYAHDSFSSPFGTNGTTGTVSVLGQLSVPIYQGGAEEARIREAKEGRSQTRLNIYDADLSTRQSVKDTWNSFHAAQSAVGYNERRVTAAVGALDGVIQQQHQGERLIIDILNAEQERFAAEIAYTGARHDMVVTAYQMVTAEGRLTAKDQGLKVKLYDPNEHYDENADKWFGFGD